MANLAGGSDAAGHRPPGDAPAPPVSWWRLPFSADTWRRTLYAVVALPVAVVCVPLTVVGGSAAATRLQEGLASRLLELRVNAPRHRGVDGRVLGHALLSLPLGVVSLVLAVYLWLLVIGNVAYPLRGGDLSTAWGGPSLAGAWAVHGAGGLAFLFVTPWIIKGVTTLQGRLLQRMLGAR